MKPRSAVAFLALLAPGLPAHAAGPVIDVHRHATWPGSDDAPYRAQTLAEMDAHGVVLALLSLTEPGDVADWVEAAPDRFLAGPMLPCPRNLAEPRYRCFAEGEGWVDIGWLRDQAGRGNVGVIHEVTISYAGLSPANPRLAPYWALAEELDLPVGIHTQRGPGPGAKHSPRQHPGCCPDYDPAMGNPELLRPVLERHPGLRVWLQHVGAGGGDHPPFPEETLALLRDFPNVYVDLAITNGAMPFEQYEATLRQLFDAGFGDRIMFGSDNLPIAMILPRLEQVEWLTDAQRRAILYDNAARFLRLDEATIARHHGR
ncbi:MAG TPA: amidohydrolase family protein [Xanthomonadaceae bacterium]|nr:amidohydrolase family protein [Xanthomonadaceae bacterium]